MSTVGGRYGRFAYKLVNNKVEGDGPLTVRSLVGILRGNVRSP